MQGGEVGGHVIKAYLYVIGHEAEGAETLLDERADVREFYDAVMRIEGGGEYCVTVRVRTAHDFDRRLGLVGTGA